MTDHGVFYFAICFRPHRNTLDCVRLSARLRHRLLNFTEASSGELCWLGGLDQPAARFLLGDEPTGNLDRQTGTEIMNFIREFNESLAMTIIMITHERVSLDVTRAA